MNKKSETPVVIPPFPESFPVEAPEYFNFGYDVIGPLEDYLVLCDDVVRYPGNTLELTADTPAQTAVLTCPVK